MAAHGTAAERSHLRRFATGGGVIQSLVVQPFTPSARAVTAVPPIVRTQYRMTTNDWWVLWLLGGVFTAAGLVLTLAASALATFVAKVEGWYVKVVPFLQHWPRLEKSSNRIILRIVGISYLMGGVGSLVAACVLAMLN